MLRRRLSCVFPSFLRRSVYSCVLFAGVGAGLLVGLAPASASVGWRGDFESANWSQWDGNHLQVVSGGSAAVESSVVRQGSYAAKFTTPPYDGTNRSRSQIYLNGNSSYGNEGQENWFGWSSMIPAGSTLSNGGWNNLTSFHQQNIANTLPAPDHFAVTNSGGVWTLRLDSWGGDYVNSTGWNKYRQTWNLLNLSPGVWYDVVFHVKWSADPSVGFVEVWINGQRVLALAHAATLYTGDAIYLKQGYDGGGVGATTTVYNDGTVIASDYAGAISAFPAGSWPVSAPGGTATTTSTTTTTTSSTAPATVSNSLIAGASLSGTYDWNVTTSGDCVAVEYWATDTAGVARKLATVSGSGSYVYHFDTSTLGNGSYLFGVVEDSSAGARYKDPNRVAASVQNTSTTTTPVTTTTATTTTTPTTTATTTTTTPTTTATTTTPTNNGKKPAAPPGQDSNGNSSRSTSSELSDARVLAVAGATLTPGRDVRLLSTAVRVDRARSLRISVIRTAGTHRRVPLLAHSLVGDVDPMYWRKTIVTGAPSDGLVLLRLRLPEAVLRAGAGYAVRVRAVGSSRTRTIYIRFQG
ncbi:MAG: polysaccharide lyase [Actinomycetota bacterium]